MNLHPVGVAHASAPQVLVVGRVRVVSIKPDRAVAVVIREFARGVIQRGDKVATRLRA